nr:pentapeptide repeat-containing protein [Nodosilinea sp. TSF1-S3]
MPLKDDYNQEASPAAAPKLEGIRSVLAMTQPVADITTAVALLQTYAAGRRDFANLVLSAVDLAGVDLKGADLSYADLSGSDLTGANLRGADLSYANLAEADLSGADLRGAMLIGTDLQTATLTGAVLVAADYDPHDTHFPAGFDPVQAGLKSDR